MVRKTNLILHLKTSNYGEIRNGVKMKSHSNERSTYYEYKKV